MDLRPLIRRVLWVAGIALAFLLLAALGLFVATLLPGDVARPEPEPVPATPRPPRPVPEPPPPPPPPRPAAVSPLPPPAPVAEPESPKIPAPKLAIHTRLRIRRDILRDIGALKEEMAQCPSEPVTTDAPLGGRAALVFEGVAESGALRLASSHLEADHPVNDRFVACARGVLEGKRLPVPNLASGTRLRLYIPIGPRGNALSLPASSITDAEPP